MRNDASAASTFFLLWMVIGSFVALNLFVGAIVDNFTRIKAESDGSATMTPEQQQWANAMRSLSEPTRAARRPRIDCCGLRGGLFTLIQSQPFEYFVMGIIILNVFGMALDFHGMENDEVLSSTYRNGMLFFTYFYYVEFVIKLTALGDAYFRDAWCRFDFFLVIMSFLDQFFLELLLQFLPLPPTVLRVLRVARVLRILRLLKNLKGLRDLVMTIVAAFPSLINIAALFGIIIFMYAVLGLNVFTYVMYGDNISHDRNFESFGNACLVLFQCLTGDGWSAIMIDAMVDEERGCDPNPADGSPSDCGSPLALPFFISFVVIGTFIFLNLVIAVILENFTALGNVNPDLVSANDIADFKESWANFDPEAQGAIPVLQLPELVASLKPPLGLHGTTLQEQPVKFCLTLGLTSRNGAVAFKPVLDALIDANYKSKKVVVDHEAVASIVGLQLEDHSAGWTVEELDAERYRLSEMLAYDLFRGLVRRLRKRWEDHPETHPSHPMHKQRARMRTPSPTPKSPSPKSVRSNGAVKPTAAKPAATTSGLYALAKPTAAKPAATTTALVKLVAIKAAAASSKKPPSALTPPPRVSRAPTAACAAAPSSSCVPAVTTSPAVLAAAVGEGATSPPRTGAAKAAAQAAGGVYLTQEEWAQLQAMRSAKASNGQRPPARRPSPARNASSTNGQRPPARRLPPPQRMPPPPLSAQKSPKPMLRPPPPPRC